MLDEGIAAGFDLLGIDYRTVAYVERDAYAAATLVARMESAALDHALVWDDLTTFDGRAMRGIVDCVSAGFPCQDLSVAGARAGLDGKRSGLFFNVLDIADDCEASILVLENVAGIASASATVVDECFWGGAAIERAASRVVGELADRGWSAEWLHLSAAEVGASHGRERWFCFAWRALADTESERRRQRKRDEFAWRAEAEGSGDALADAARIPSRERSGREQFLDRHSVLGDTEHRPAWDSVAGSAGSQEKENGRGPFGTADSSGILEHTESVGRRQRRSESGGLEGRSPATEHGGTVADASNPGLQGDEQREPSGSQQREPASGPASELHRTLLFAPSPVDERWPGIIANRPDLAPAIEPGVRVLVDGVAYLVDESRADQLRCGGNGVVALCAAAAIVELVRRSGLMNFNLAQEAA